MNNVDPFLVKRGNYVDRPQRVGVGVWVERGMLLGDVMTFTVDSVEDLANCDGIIP